MANQVDRINKLEKEAAELSIRLKKIEGKQSKASGVRRIILKAVAVYLVTALVLLAIEQQDFFLLAIIPVLGVILIEAAEWFIQNRL